jgi:hypothetical protein
MREIIKPCPHTTSLTPPADDDATEQRYLVANYRHQDRIAQAAQRFGVNAPQRRLSKSFI